MEWLEDSNQRKDGLDPPLKADMSGSLAFGRFQRLIVTRQIILVKT